METTATELLEVQRILNYTFKNKLLLQEALTHSSFATPPNYQRLEFIGDAALGLALSNYVFKMYTKLHQGQMTLLGAANVSNEKFARVAVKHGLFRFLRHNNPSLHAKVREFANAVSKENGKIVHRGFIKAPKILADIVESIAGAIYVGVDFDLQKLWLIFRRLLKPIITWEKLEQQPVTKLYEMCQKQGKQVDIRYRINGTKHTARLFVDGEFVASCSSDQNEKAKLEVVRIALRKLMQQTSTAEDAEIKGAKQKLNELCLKRKWPMPNYKIETEEGPSHEKKYICSVEIARYRASGDEKRRIKEAENSAASFLMRTLQASNSL